MKLRAAHLRNCCREGVHRTDGDWFDLAAILNLHSRRVITWPLPHMLSCTAGSEMRPNETGLGNRGVQDCNRFPNTATANSVQGYQKSPRLHGFSGSMGGR